jgi:hypothetical protein
MRIDPIPTPPSRDDPASFAARADAFLPAIVVAGAQMNDVADEVDANADRAASAAATAINAPGTSATSTTQLAIGTGAKTLAVQVGKAFVVGQFVTIAQTGTPGNWMAGQITAYDAGSGGLTVQVLATSGGGQASAWTIGLSSPMQFTAATAAEILAGVSATRVVTPAGLLAAGAPQALVDAATITPDMNAGLNFTLTLGGNRTLANPVNASPGQGGVIAVTQDATGGRSLAFGSAWDFPGGAPSLSPGGGYVDAISYFVVSASQILCTLVRNFR